MARIYELHLMFFENSVGRNVYFCRSIVLYYAFFTPIEAFNIFFKGE